MLVRQKIKIKHKGFLDVLCFKTADISNEDYDIMHIRKVFI